MSPPIRDGSGNSIGSIRLGDGSEIAAVRTGAGDVVFGESGILHGFDFSSSNPKENIVSGNADLNTGSYSGTTTTINGKQAGRFDASSQDGLQATFSSKITEPFHDHMVFEVVTKDTDSTTFYDGGTRDEVIFNDNSGNFHIFSGSGIQGSAYSENVYSVSIIWDSTDELYRNGNSTAEISGNAGSNSATGVTLAENGDFAGSNNGDIKIGEWRRYDPTAPAYSRTGVESELRDKWNF